MSEHSMNGADGKRETKQKRVQGGTGKMKVRKRDWKFRKQRMWKWCNNYVINLSTEGEQRRRPAKKEIDRRHGADFNFNMRQRFYLLLCRDGLWDVKYCKGSVIRLRAARLVEEESWINEAVVNKKKTNFETASFERLRYWNLKGCFSLFTQFKFDL